MNSFWSEMSSFLKVCMFNTLKNATWKIVTMVRKEKRTKIVSVCEKQVLPSANEFRTLVESSSSGYSVTDFSRGERMRKFDGLLTVTGLVGMLEVEDNGGVDMAFPAFAGSADRSCERNDDSMTKCFVSFVQLYQIYFSNGRCPASS